MNKFLIDHIDPLGQGVYKQADQIYFIPKTLPGESGEFEVIRSAKGVNFAKITKLDQASSLRITPECPFYDDCNGCHYLHTNYENEKALKLNAFKKMLAPLGKDLPEISIIQNGERFHYRNRIQLHYHLGKKLLGFKAGKSKYIFPVTNCLIASKNIQTELQKITTNNEWTKLVPKKSKTVGHLELYDNGAEVQYFWNQNYAAGGFTQVNSQVNQIVQHEIAEIFSDQNLSILDLFGGNGNLVKQISCKKKLSVDIYHSKNNGPENYHLDLYDNTALEKFSNTISDKFDTLFADPPRSGFKQLEDWVNHYQPKQILYVSCHPATMVRDIIPLLAHYQISKIYLIEFFPGTFHFEAAIVLNSLK